MFCSSLALKAQLLDTSQAHNYKPLEVYRVAEEGLDWLNEDSSAMDTSMNRLASSYLGQAGLPFMDLGFEASPTYNLTSAEVAPMRFELGVPSLERFFYDNELHRYHSDRPFTRLKYSQGANEFIYIEAKHGQEISRRLTIGVDYRRLKNQNFYFSNISNADRIRFSNLFNTKFYTGYYTKDRRYEMLVGFLWNKNQNVESGGLEDPEDFISKSGRTKTNNNPVLLSSASNGLVEHSYFLKQYFRLKGAPLDSQHKSDLGRFHSQFVLKTAFSFKRAEFEDESPDSSYYGVALDELYDSLSHRSISNQFFWQARLKEQAVHLGAEHRFDHLYQDSNAYNYQSLYAFGHYRMSGKTNAQLRAEYGLSGYNQGDYDLWIRASRSVGGFRLGLAANSRSVQPNFLHTQFVNSAVSWILLSPLKTRHLGLKLSASKSWKSSHLQIAAHIHRYQNIIFWDSSVLTAQQGNANLNALTINYQIFSKHHGLEVKLAAQQSSNQAVLPRPQILANGRYYVQFQLFNKQLTTQLGVNSEWYSNYNAPVWDPLIRQWRNRNTTFEYSPPLGLFLNAKVKSFHFGFNFYHIQQGLMGEDYFRSPNYPMMPRVFRLNIQWDLAN